MPQIIGGGKALQKYIDTNLIYPEQARIKRIEGTVYLNAEIDDNGKVYNVEIIKGIEGGCNEEAVRLIKNISFGRVTNKGIRLKAKKQFRIKFHLPLEKGIKYQITDKLKEPVKPEAVKKYSYIIQINKL